MGWDGWDGRLSPSASLLRAPTVLIRTQEKDFSGILLMNLIRQFTCFVKYFDMKRISAQKLDEQKLA